MSENTGSSMICGACGIPLELQRRRLRYMEHEFYAELPCCPRCRQFYISEELAVGRIHQLELQLEDK